MSETVQSNDKRFSREQVTKATETLDAIAMIGVGVAFWLITSNPILSTALELLKNAH